MGYTSPYPYALRYRPITEVGHNEVVALLQRAMEASASRDVADHSAEQELREFIEHAGDAYHPDTWVVAFDNDRPVGIVFAQRYDDKLEEGSLFFIGVLPEYRGAGLGKVLHAKGLEMLSEIGVKEYVGSTDVQNNAMLHAFAANGCRLYAVREVDTDTGEIIV